VKRLLLIATLALSAVLAACSGGGGSTIPPPPPTGGFSDSSLKGQYAFSVSGVTANCSGGQACGAYAAQTGSFVADGAGNIKSAMEDLVDLAVSPTSEEVTFASGSYSVQADGRGTLTLQDSAGNKVTFAMYLQSSSQGFLVETDGLFAASGSFNLQTAADFLASSFNGNYVFDFSGVTLTGASPNVISIIGNMTANGSGLITGGVSDTNDGVSGPSGASTIAQTAYTLDPANGTTFGRGTLQFASGYTFAFYIVDATRIKFIEEDSFGGSSGDGVLQSGAIPTTTAGFTGSFAYLVGGWSPAGPDAAAACFTANAGGIGTISYDENNDGGPFHVSQGSNISSATYAMDTTNAGSGRGTLTFTDSSHGTFQYVFYLGTPTSGVIQNSASGYVEDGTMFPQTGSPFTLPNLAGNYVFNWSGVDLSSSSVENFVGQYALASGASNNISGVLDGNIVSSTGMAPYPNIGTQGTLTINSNGTNNNAYQIVAGSPLSTTYNYQAYIVDANTVLLVGTDNTRVLAGFVSRQSQ
jgi:hypothetical protein